jgi:hypothetical protein
MAFPIFLFSGTRSSTRPSGEIALMKRLGQNKGDHQSDSGKNLFFT